MRETTASFKGIRIASCEWKGNGPCVILLHGSGPGASSSLAWAPLIPGLIERGHHVVAADLVGFGRSDRKPGNGFDVELWADQVEFLVNRHASPETVVMAHSFSASFALRVARRNSKVAKLVLSAPAAVRHKITEGLEASWSAPRDQAELRSILSWGVADQALVTDDGVRERWSRLSNGDYLQYFAAMFHDDRQARLDALHVDAQILEAIAQPVLVVHGRSDSVIPYRQAVLPLVERLPRCDFVLLDHCAHAPALERTFAVQTAVSAFLSQ